VRWERRARTERGYCPAQVALTNPIVGAPRGWTATVAGGGDDGAVGQQLKISPVFIMIIIINSSCIYGGGAVGGNGATLPVMQGDPAILTVHNERVPAALRFYAPQHTTWIVPCAVPFTVESTAQAKRE